MKKALSRITVMILIVMFILSSVSALAMSYGTVVKRAMPVYSDKGMNHWIGTVPKGTVVIVKDEYHNTTPMNLKLNVNGKICYASSVDVFFGDEINKYIPKGRSSFPTVQVTKLCWAYSYPSTNSLIALKMLKGTKLLKIAENKKWVLCSNGTYFGYIQKKNLSD